MRERGVEFLWAVCLYVCMCAISSQLLGPTGLIFSGYVGVMYGIAQFRYDQDMLRYKNFLLVAIFCYIVKNVNFLDFMLYFSSLPEPITTKLWLVAGIIVRNMTQGVPGVARGLPSGFQAEMGCFCLFCKKPCGIKRGVWRDPPPILGRNWPPGIKRGFGGILPYSRAYLAPWCQSLASIGLGYVAPVVAALVRRATACDTST